MSVTGKRGAGIPIVLLHDSIGGVITVEMKNGCLYRGTLDDCQDNMNMTIKVSIISLTCLYICSILIYSLFYRTAQK
ncbi:hypothetical protein EON65_21935 [archaeon]|nr:MAG: hypothetical protein EON65_21935 [archaeon]